MKTKIEEFTDAVALKMDIEELVNKTLEYKKQ